MLIKFLFDALSIFFDAYAPHIWDMGKLTIELRVEHFQGSEHPFVIQGPESSFWLVEGPGIILDFAAETVVC